LFILSLGLGSYYLIPFAFDIPESITTGPRKSVTLLDRNGEPLDHWVRKDYYRHRATSLEELPEDLVNATLAAEDKRFLQHGGIDFRATARALKDSWEQKRFVSGASTITQQTVKISSKKSSRTLITKVRECLTARHVEMKLNKGQILTSYFNHLDYGNRNQGPLQASRHYFGKPLNQLSLAECALLAGLPQAPSRLNPRRNPDAAIKRRNWILDRMAIVYNLPQSRISQAKSEPLKLKQSNLTRTAPHLAQIMRKSQINQDKEASISTSLSSSLQKDVTDIVRKQVKLLSKKHIQHAGVIVINNATGEVLVHIGSPYFNQANSGEVDATRTPRSPGSALKPFTYLLAFEKGGMTPASIIADIPTRYPSSLGLKQFVNYKRQHNGPVTIHKSLATSLNVPAVRTLNSLGGPAPLHKILQEFGISTLTEEPLHYGLGLTLGSGDVTLLELTNAYATLARMGSYRPVTYLANNPSISPSQNRASYQSCWMLAETMSNNEARSAAFGPNSSLRLPFPCAVKTGTSTDFRDNWCLGFTKDFTVGVWVGNLDNTPMRGISGVSGAGPIFQATMLRLHKNHTPSWFDQPKNLAHCHIHVFTGKRMLQQSSHTVSMSLPKNRLPSISQKEDFDGEGRIILDMRYSEWMKKEGDSNLFAPHTTNNRIASQAALRIISPSRDASYLLDPDLPGQGKLLLLQTDFPGKVTWKSPTLTIQTHENSHTVTLTPGEHQIILEDDNGRTTNRKILVEQL